MAKHEGGFSRAFLFGGIAATVCSVLWHFIAAFSSYELLMVSMLVGLVVGGAVRRGAGRKTGWVYPVLAMGLAYASIVCAYLPAVVDGIQSASADEARETRKAREAHAAGHAHSEFTGPPAVAMSTQYAVLLAIPLTLASPFLLATTDLAAYLISLLILSIALSQAWKASRTQAQAR